MNLCFFMNVFYNGKVFFLFELVEISDEYDFIQYGYVKQGNEVYFC